MIAKNGEKKLSPQVSIVMNCFNSEKYLNQAIESVIAQNFVNWELIFWDNQSTDNSAIILNSYKDSRIKYFYADKHTTLGKARNMAVSKARGKWLAFIDCDDFWDSRKLELQLSTASKYQNDIGLVYSLFKLKLEKYQQDSGERAYKYYQSIVLTPHGPKSIFNELLNGNNIIFSSVLMLRSLFNQVGGIDPDLRQLEDYDLLLKISRLTSAICIDSESVIYRVHASNNSHNQGMLSYLEFDRIFSRLPQTKYLQFARKKNHSRHGVALIRIGKFYTGSVLILKLGSILWILKSLFYRISIDLVRWVLK